MAFKIQNEEIILALTDFNADLNQVDDSNHTPLAYASEKLLLMLNLFKGVTYLKPDHVI